MKLRNAMLCLDCDEVFEQEVVHFLDQKVAMDYCPSCASSTVVRLCRWLPTMNQTEENKRKTMGGDANTSAARIVPIQNSIREELRERRLREKNNTKRDF